ncbi:MAG: hypothetical protein EBZ59_02785 [Planctomycetia bacterium]|nr:hypothetical protein [Planctomycetia bacterium]
MAGRKFPRKFIFWRVAAGCAPLSAAGSGTLGTAFSQAFLRVRTRIFPISNAGFAAGEVGGSGPIRSRRLASGRRR